jgi:hypothetical protein
MSRSFAVVSALAATLLLALALAAACSSASKLPPAAHGRFTSVYVLVAESEGDDAQVRVVLIDSKGRRSGRTAHGLVEEISGCRSGGGVNTDRFNDEYVPRDSSGALLDSIPANASTESMGVKVASTPEFHPQYYDFTVVNDGVTPRGLIDQGVCELRLEPVVPGAVTLAISAEGAGFTMCKDTTSVVVQRGVPLRWMLTWKSEGEHCVVKMARIGAPSSNRTSKR